MNENFQSLIENARKISASKVPRWEIELDDRGVAKTGCSWNLQTLSEKGKPKKMVLRTFSEFVDAQKVLLSRGLLTESEVGLRPVSQHWQDLIKAFVLDFVSVKKKSVSFAINASQAFRFLATVARKEPWLVTSEDVLLACEISNICQSTDARTINLMALIRNFVDVHHIFNTCPVGPLVDHFQPGANKRAKFAKTKSEILSELMQRKTAEKLPEKRAFWELVNIIYSQTPTSVVDFLRFSFLKLLLLTGLRIGEVVEIPLDWRRIRSFTDYRGRPAGESGGISESLEIRHFAEKQGEPFLVEKKQFVPEMFRSEIETILGQVAALTAPLRATLRAQYESGSVFPQYEPEALVDAVTMYVHLTGNPIWTHPPYSSELTQCIDRYKKTFELKELLQMQRLQDGTTQLAAAVSRFFSEENRNKGLILRDAGGSPTTGRGIRGKFLRVSDAESYVKNHVPTKLSDLAPLRLNQGGALAPWEMLFLMPKRAVAEGRGNSIVDLFNTYSVGIADSALLLTVLGEESNSEKVTIFSRYGTTAEVKALTLTSYTFRHLQTTELFRLGISDAVITKRFNRKSVAQSSVYDHRSLAEQLDAIELPDEWSALLGEGNTSTVAKLIFSGKTRGPIVQEFKRVQTEEGDEAALLFLKAEADGFHVTPYGMCINSFTVDPCPKSLECFNDCRHLSSTGLPEHKKNLVTLLGRLKHVLEHAKSKPDGTIGKQNQIQHATKRIVGVEKLLTTSPGELVFPDGVDLSLPKNQGGVLDGT